MKEEGIKKEIDVLVNTLKTDEGYYISWQANIAMAVYDEIMKLTSINHENVHKACNDGAKNFLERLMMEK